MEPQQQPLNKPNIKRERYHMIYGTLSWNQIKQSLKSIANQQWDLKMIANFISHNAKVYSQEYKQEKLSALYAYKDSDLIKLFGKMAKAVLQFQKVYHQNYIFPIFKRNDNIEWNYSKAQMAVLLSLMTLCLTLKQQSKYMPKIFNFSIILANQEVKTRTILLYLQQELGKESPQYMTVRRISQQKLLNSKLLLDLILPLSELFIDNKGGIEDHYGSIKIDFANKFIGGASLRFAKSQQQIMFINRPQLYTTILFCQMMQPHQALAFLGFKKYFKQKGYASKVQYDGLQPHQYTFTKNRADEFIVAIDALPYPKQQRNQAQMLRQINKAMVGFKSIDSPSVATGNWGCGVFRGDVQLKFLLQWIACSVLGKKIIYCPFANKRLVEVEKVVGLVRGVKVGELYSAMMKLNKEKGVFEQIIKYFS